MPRKRKVPVVDQENVEETFKKPITPPVPTKTTKKKKKAEEDINDLPNPKKQKDVPVWIRGEVENVAKLIISVQKSDVNNAKVITELAKLYKKVGHASFMTVLVKVTIAFLMRDEADEYAPRVLKFIGTFVASFGEEVCEDDRSHPIIACMFKEILSITSKHWHIRARICALVTNIMNSFSQKAEIDEAIMDAITERMLGTFIKDISPVVRQNAIMALQRLQDPDKGEDPVTKVYLYHIETDPIAKVRQTAITAIAKKLPVFPAIIDRLQDNDEKVRRHTYLQMASVPVKSYKIVDRIKFLAAGLHDRSEMVRKAVNNVFLPNWIAAYENDYTEFVRAIKLDASDKELIKFRALAQDVLSVIFKKRKAKELIAFLNINDESEYKNCLPVEKTNNLEWLIMWKMVIKAHQNYTEGKHKDENLEEDEDADNDFNDTISNVNIMPELSVFCDYFEKFLDEFKQPTGSEAKYQKLNFSHCIILLLEIAQLNDFGDEIGKERLQQLMKKILMEHEVSEYVIKEIALVMELLVNKVDLRLEFFEGIVTEMMNLDSPNEYRRTEIIDDLIQKANMDIKVKANSLKMEMMDLKEKESVYVELKKYGDAQKVSETFKTLHAELMQILAPIAEENNCTATLAASETTSIGSKKATPVQVIKNLRICFYSLTMKGVKALTKPSLNIYNGFVRYHLETDDIMTRIWALKSATACSLLYEPMVKDVYRVLKGQMFKTHNIAVWETLIGCTVDLLLRYSIEKMDQQNDPNDLEKSRSKKGGRTLYIDDGEEEVDNDDIVKDVAIIQMLMHVLDNNPDITVYKACIVGLCKLFLHGQYNSRELVSKFLIAYFNPATEAEINQILGIFFESMVRLKKQEALHDALIPTLMTLLEAPYDSPLKEVKHETVIKYVIGATRPVFCSNGLNLHNTLALKLIEMMRENADCKEVQKTFSKELPTLEISEDPLLKKDMLSQIESLLKNISVDVRTRKSIVDFRDTLSGTYKAPLKFSSTAMATAIEVDEDAGIPEEEEKDEELYGSEKENGMDESEDRLNRSEVLDEPAPKVSLPEAVVNITLLSQSRINRLVNNSQPLSSESELEESLTVPETQSPASNANNSKLNESSVCQEVSLSSNSLAIPQTQDPEEVEESDDDLEDSVVECSLLEDEVPATPGTPKSVGRPKRNFPSKRHLEISMTSNSPMRKNPRNGASPKVTTPTTNKKLPKSALATPKTPRFSALHLTEQSTPVSERRTRKQAMEDVAEAVTLTRSASRKMNVDPQAIVEKIAMKKTPSRTPAKEKAAEPENPKVQEAKTSKQAAKKTSSILPVPTKTSKLRTAKLSGIPPKPDKAATSSNPSTAPKLIRTSSQSTIPITRTRNASKKTASTTTLAGSKQPRPRWN